MMENNIEVAARIRPPIHSNHLSEDVCLYADPYTKEIVLANQMSFYVDYALPLEINQSQLFDSIVSHRIDRMLQGHDVSFIAYGHVNSGKTYTMLGPGLHCASSETTYGLLPRSGREMFSKLLAFRQQFGLQFKVFVSFIEICNEEAKDLLASYNNTAYNDGNIGFRTNEKGLTVLYGIEEIECRTVSELFNSLRVGMSYRKTVRTNLNSLSSLSHCIVIIKVQQKWFSNQGKSEMITSRAMFVDLAGSEQMFLMSPIDSNHVHHTTVGNTGLGVISAIIASFSGQWLPSSPFTQSLLFPLLKDSFIGSMKTLLICCLSPSSSDYSETLNSLRLIEHIHTLNKYSFVKDNVFNVNNSYQIIDDSEESNINYTNRNDVNGTTKDSLGLEFAASQWLKLVSNAEDLFNKLVDKDVPDDAREQIEEWLCLKQECEECFSVETRTIVNNNNNQNHTDVRSLEIIEEVTETDTKSKSDKSSVNNDSLSSDDSDSMVDSNTDDENLDEEDNIRDEVRDEEENRISDDDDENDDLENNIACSKGTIYGNKSLDNSRRDDFAEKLDRLMKKFVLYTDEKVDSIINVSTPERDALELEKEKEAKNVVIPKPNRCNIGRRKSILPCGNQILLCDLSPEQKRVSNESVDESCLNNNNSNEYVKDVIESIDVNGKDRLKSTESLSCNENSELGDVCSKQQTNSFEPEKACQHLTANSNIKQSQLGLANLDLEAASKRIEELQSMIKIKEQFIEEMIKNSGARISAKAKFQRKHTRLEEEYYKAKAQLAKAEKALNHEVGNVALENDVQKYKSLANRYEKRLQDIETIKQIAGDSAKKVLELENSLHSSKRKMQKLKKQLKKEEEHKYCLERELVEDQKRIKLLEEKCKNQSEKLKTGILTADNDERHIKLPKLITDEDAKSENFKLSQKLNSPSQDMEIALERRELLLREQLSHEKNMSKSLLHVSAWVSHLEHVLKEKSTVDLEEGDLDSKEALRHEIRNLRKTRDYLLEERKKLDTKLSKDKVLTTVEERKFIECDEAVEAIDGVIEYKNELICGRKGLISIIENGQHEKGEEMLLLRLMKLSTVEMQILLYKYFRKVVDLRESGRKMESQIAELDRQAETQAWKIQALSNALQQAHLESERRLIAAQKEHQEKLHLIFRHFADETSGHSSGADDTEKCRRQNKALKQRILELEAMLYKARSSQQTRNEGSNEVANISGAPGQELQSAIPGAQLTIPRHNLRQLGGALAQHTTKVTRQKNKLIIQQQKTNKKPSK